MMDTDDELFNSFIFEKSEEIIELEEDPILSPDLSQHTQPMFKNFAN